jgi:hypothetical protein
MYFSYIQCVLQAPPFSSSSNNEYKLWRSLCRCFSLLLSHLPLIQLLVCSPYLNRLDLMLNSTGKHLTGTVSCTEHYFYSTPPPANHHSTNTTLSPVISITIDRFEIVVPRNLGGLHCSYINKAWKGVHCRAKISKGVIYTSTDISVRKRTVIMLSLL